MILLIKYLKLKKQFNKKAYTDIFRKYIFLTLILFNKLDVVNCLLNNNKHK